jgi:hypothetical protein
MHFKTSSALVAVLAAFGLAAAGCGSDAKVVEQPAVITGDGSVVPLPTEDGELKEGETKIELEQPGEDKEIKVQVDD